MQLRDLRSSRSHAGVDPGPSGLMRRQARPTDGYGSLRLAEVNVPSHRGRGERRPACLACLRHGEVWSSRLLSPGHWAPRPGSCTRVP